MRRDSVPSFHRTGFSPSSPPVLSLTASFLLSVFEEFHQRGIDLLGVVELDYFPLRSRRVMQFYSRHSPPSRDISLATTLERSRASFANLVVSRQLMNHPTASNVYLLLANFQSSCDYSSKEHP